MNLVRSRLTINGQSIHDGDGGIVWRVRPWYDAISKWRVDSYEPIAHHHWDVMALELEEDTFVGASQLHWVSSCENIPNAPVQCAGHDVVATASKWFVASGWRASAWGGRYPAGLLARRGGLMASGLKVEEGGAPLGDFLAEHGKGLRKVLRGRPKFEDHMVPRFWTPFDRGDHEVKVGGNTIRCTQLPLPVGLLADEDLPAHLQPPTVAETVEQLLDRGIREIGIGFPVPVGKSASPSGLRIFDGSLEFFQRECAYFG